MAAAYVIVEMKISDPSATGNTWRQRRRRLPRPAVSMWSAAAPRVDRRRLAAGALAIWLPSFEQAKAWYDGERYREARAKRAGATEFFNMILAEGVETQP